jgi:hypothetical protein
MKLITAVVKPEIADDLIVAATGAGARGMTAAEVIGFGQQYGHGHPDGSTAVMLPKIRSLGRMSASAAAFDTRLAGPAAFTGRAAKGIAGLLKGHGLTLLEAPKSFLVGNDNKLRPGEEDRAQEWGEALAARMPAAADVRP